MVRFLSHTKARRHNGGWECFSFLCACVTLCEFIGSFFWTGLQDFSGLTGLGFTHDNPEKSCQNNGSVLFNHGLHG